MIKVVQAQFDSDIIDTVKANVNELSSYLRVETSCYLTGYFFYQATNKWLIIIPSHVSSKIKVTKLLPYRVFLIVQGYDEGNTQAGR